MGVDLPGPTAWLRYTGARDIATSAARAERTVADARRETLNFTAVAEECFVGKGEAS
jgi:hypothetical protein